MDKTITKLSAEQTRSLVKDFLENLGRRIERKREIRNLSQSELSECLNIDRTTLSRYENGERDMPVSTLPLLSTYCKFPLYELFPKEDSRAILDTFAKAVSITVNRKKRHDTLRQVKKDKAEYLREIGHERVLKGQVYEIDGKEIFEPVPPKKQKSLREQYKDAEVQTNYRAFSEKEFYNYVIEQKPEIADSISAAGQFLEQIEGLANKETLKGMVADYIVDGIVIDSVSKERPDELSKRAYAYYQQLYWHYQNEADGLR